MSTSLAACNNDEGAMDTNYDNSARPIGYYSNENVNQGNGVNFDNDGPITEMMDGRADNNNYFTRVNNRHNNFNNGKMDNPTVPLGTNDQGLVRDNRYSNGDANYHNHTNEVGYYNRGDKELSEKVANRVGKIENVDDVQTLVTDDNVLVAIDTNDRNDADMKEKITSEVRKMVKGRNVQVVTDERTFTRVRDIDNDIQNGGERTDIDTDIEELMNDLGDAIQRPFTGDRD